LNCETKWSRKWREGGGEVDKIWSCSSKNVAVLPNEKIYNRIYDIAIITAVKSVVMQAPLVAL
jgi:hypothetical protein